MCGTSAQAARRARPRAAATAAPWIASPFARTSWSTCARSICAPHSWACPCHGPWPSRPWAGSCSSIPRGTRRWDAGPLARVEASGYKSVVLTVDVQVYSRRERDIVHRYSPREAMKSAPNPRGPDPNYPERLTWDDVAWLKKTTRLPIGLKGIMTVRDAKRAVEEGVDIIWVSNHGGRQLDHTQGSIDALPPIADAVAGRAAIIVDGGFTRGTAVLKGLALGATVVAIGRTVLWGLAADGAGGVACALEILRRELKTTMALAGQTSVKNLDRDLVFRVD